ncbi:MAG: NUDIX hydrolase [Actinomycetes bacterium]
MECPKPSPPLRRPLRALRRVEETSAGGVVIDSAGPCPRVAVIGRLSRRGRLEWCLPKGHLEGRETAEEAAIREVHEETGLIARIVAPLGTIDYWFIVGDRRVHKVVHHFLLLAVGGSLSVDGDPDGEAVAVAWVPVGELDERLAFPNERRLVTTVTDLLADTA